jgi:hypothetical protein
MYFLKIIFNIFLFGYVNFLYTFAYINLIIMSNKEKLKEFKEKMENLISQMEDVLEMMPIKGNSSSDCQRTYLQQQINEVSYAVNGVEDSDFKED